ncbi:MAG: hypothetical protein H6Q14_1767 [Bacteroidetes bacterium]|nr:hypothetical protein [Bacteroidota bacterium]
MKKLTLILVFATSILALNAQNITGRITDKEGHGIESSAIVLQTMDSIYIDASYSDSLGNFYFQKNLTKYRLVIQNLMYKSLEKEFCNPDAGNIQLENKDLNLQEVVVKAERPLVKVVDGKMTYDMTLLLQNKIASNAYDALLELPGVSEQNDALNLAGSNGVSVIINGKASSMTAEQMTALLKSIPKERIQYAEVMYNTPPQYHLRGASINLVLKDGVSQTPQWQGQVNGNASQSHYANYDAGISLSYSSSLFSTDFMYQVMQTEKYMGLGIDSHHLYDGELYEINQDNVTKNNNLSHNIRLGNELLLSSKDKISVVYTTQIQTKNRPTAFSKGSFSDSENRGYENTPIQLHNLAMNYTSGFGLSVGTDYTSYKKHSGQDYEEKLTGKETAFTATSKQDINRLTLNADQSHILANKWTLNYGANFIYASDKSSQVYYSDKGKDLSSSNTQSALNEYTYQAYAGFSKEFSESFSLKASFTGEYYQHKDKRYRSLVPQLDMTYVIDPNRILQFSLSSDKTYPSYWAMINSVSYLDGYTEIDGNPDLRPTRSYETSLTYILKNKYIFSLNASLEDDYSMQLPYQSQERLVLIYKTVNFDYKENLGLYLLVPFRISSWMDSKFMLYGYYDQQKNSNFYETSFNDNIFSVYTNLNNTFNISSKPNIKAELSGAFCTKNIQGPAILSSIYQLNAGLKWASNDSKAEIRFKVNDMFNSWTPKSMKTHFDTQNLDISIISDTQYVSLSFSYKFGGYKEKKHKEVDTSRFAK